LTESNQIEDRIEDAKRTLFEHWTSKSTNQTSMLLGYSVALFTLFQAYSVLPIPLKFQNMWLTGGFVIIFCLAIRSIGRLVYWGGLATAMVKKVFPNNDLKEGETYLGRVSDMCWYKFLEDVKEKSLQNITFKTTNSPYFKYFIVVATLITAVITFFV
jgi:hypothetical protein